MNNSLNISSKLYDYTVEFIDDVGGVIDNAGVESAFVIDKNVYRIYNDLFRSVSTDKVFLMDAIESNKNMDTVLEIINFLKNIGVRKNWIVYCFGGGITQDVTTIACNLFLRNIEWVFVPTTLLAMCDSCIGGKCGINLGQYKNQIGVFYPPKKIFVDVSFLGTLTHQDYLNGWGEIFKFSLTKYESFYENLKRINQYIPCDSIVEYIYEGLKVKKEIIEKDEFESDLRRVLNYGHTFGHALEAYTDYQVPHGEGVMWGIDVVNYIAVREGLISESYYMDIKAMIKDNFITEEIVVKEPDKLFDVISTDKKVRGNTIFFAMLNRPSNLIVYPMIIDDNLRELFYGYLEETHEYYSS